MKHFGCFDYEPIDPLFDPMTLCHTLKQRRFSGGKKPDISSERTLKSWFESYLLDKKQWGISIFVLRQSKAWKIDGGNSNGN